MKRRTLIFADMVGEGQVNGVARCIQMMADVFSRKKSFSVTWLRFTYNTVSNTSGIMSNGSYKTLSIALPQDIGRFLRQKNYRQSYWIETYKDLTESLNSTDIIHIHTLNLIEFALIVKERTKCKIVTHLHCLPWKGLYNSNMKLFNKLYQKYYILKDYHTPAMFIRHEYERQAYTKSDMVVCVTECAREFVHKICPSHSEFRVVTNGIKDMALPKNYRDRSQRVKCVFVGNSQSSKGLDVVLSVMQSILIQHPASLTVVGAIPQDIKNMVLSHHPFLDIHFTGRVGLGQLMKIYADSDIGMIASVQEQCSYVAIEMMMAGLPVVSTDVDGLSEIFSDGYNALKVPVNFHPLHGIQVDVIKMSEAVVKLINSPQLCKKIGANARRSVHNRHSIKRMTESMNDIYKYLMP